MPNPIKYSTSAQTLALKKGNFWIGTGDVGKGPTSTTDYWNGITPPAGGYTIYLNKASDGPSIYVASNDSQLISISNTIAGQTFATAAAALAWFATQTDKMVFNIDYPAIVTDGLIFNMDAGFTPSYPTTGTSWYDLSSNATTGTLTNGPTYSPADGGSIVFDGVDDYVALGTQPSWNSPTGTMAVWVKIAGLGAPGDFNSIFSNLTNTYTLHQLFASDYNSGNQTVVVSYGLAHENPNTDVYANSIEAVNNWLYVVGTRYYDGTNTAGKLYVNGDLKSTVTLSGSIEQVNNNFALCFGDSRSIIGNIAVAQIYSEELSADQVTQNYNATKSRFGL